MTDKKPYVDELLDTKAFSKIGEVIEVDGIKIIIKVDSQKNLTNLFFNGEAYRNVGIGSYIKIKKDYVYIICKVNKEFIKENLKISRDDTKLVKFDRLIEVSVIGYFDEGNFVRGIKELPYLYNEAFLISETEMNKVFQLTSGRKIPIGKALFEEVIIEAGLSKLFASHIGIFGNTGSGKSNTLARLFYNLLSCEGISLTNSKIIILDFNGEYTNDSTITSDKKNIALSTRVHRDKLKIKQEWLDEEFWGIMLQATEKTQKPFIKRCLYYQGSLQLSNIDETLDNIVRIFTEIFNTILSNGGVSNREIDAFNILKASIRAFFNINNENDYKEVFRYYSSHNGDLCRQYYSQYDTGYNPFNGHRIYFGPTKQDNVDREKHLFNQKLNELKANFNGSISSLQMFELAIGLRFVKDVLNNIAQFDHIAPIIHRFQRRKRDLEKIFDIGNNSFLESEPHVLTSVSLRDVNTEMKKIIPLLITKKIYDHHKEDFDETGTPQTLHFVIDEAHNILSEDSSRESENWKDYRLEVFEEIIKEGRKFGVFLTLASQRPSDISTTIISQLHNVFIHRLINNNDLQTMSRNISFLDRVSYDSLSILPPGSCVFTGTATETPILVQIPLLKKELQPRSETVNLDNLWFN